MDEIDKDYESILPSNGFIINNNGELINYGQIDIIHNGEEEDEQHTLINNNDIMDNNINYIRYSTINK